MGLITGVSCAKKVYWKFDIILNWATKTTGGGIAVIIKKILRLQVVKMANLSDFHLYDINYIRSNVCDPVVYAI